MTLFASPKTIPAPWADLGSDETFIFGFSVLTFYASVTLNNAEFFDIC